MILHGNYKARYAHLNFSYYLHYEKRELAFTQINTEKIVQAYKYARYSQGFHTHTQFIKEYALSHFSHSNLVSIIDICTFF